MSSKTKTSATEEQPPIDPENLQTASKYLNNLLLSRGLLRDGHPIEFAKPKESTMVTIINLVHDLVLRRDRESDHLTTLSENMQNLRTTMAQQLQHITRAETKSADLERQLAQAVAQERSTKTAFQTMEVRNRTLREESIRLKQAVSQVRAQCANDVRKRDLEMQRLKKYLEIRRGREGSGLVGVTVVNPGTLENNKTARSDGGNAHSLIDESTEHLTQLSASLSDENQALTGMLQTTISTLRTLQGLPKEYQTEPDDDSLVEYNLPADVESLSISLEEVLVQLRGLLTNPSFVPLEEVEIRDKEILRLRAAWEKMEARILELA